MQRQSLAVVPLVGAWIETNDIIRLIITKRELVKFVEGRCLPSLFFLSQWVTPDSLTARYPTHRRYLLPTFMSTPRQRQEPRTTTKNQEPQPTKVKK